MAYFRLKLPSEVDHVKRKEKVYVSYVLVLNGKYADGFRNWVRSPLRAFIFEDRRSAEIHAWTYKPKVVKIRRRTLRVLPKKRP